MRELTFDECDFAAGGHTHTYECGWGSGCNWVDEIEVIGNPGGGGGGISPFPGGEGEPGGGNGGTTDGYDDPDCTCGDGSTGPTPANTDMQKLHTLVDYAKDIFKALNPQIEHAYLFYRTASGEVAISQLLSGTLDTTAPISTGIIPDGATLIGWAHSHPADTHVDQWFPSDAANSYNGIGDWGAVDQLVAAGNASPRYDVDPNMMTYVFDVASAKMFEYDINDRDYVTPGDERDCPVH